MTTLARSNVPKADTWDLTALYSDISAWESAFKQLERQLPKLTDFQGKLGSSPEAFFKGVKAIVDISREGEKLASYAHMLSDGDTSNAINLGYFQKSINLWTRISSISSYFEPEIMAISDDNLNRFLEHSQNAEFRRMIREIRRYKPHTLTGKEEKLIAMGAEVFGASRTIFTQLNNADFVFPNVVIDGEEVTLTHSTFTNLLKNRNRQIRENVYAKYYSVYDAHKNTIAAALASSCQKDVYLAKAKHYGSARENILFADNINCTVYDNLLQTVASNLAPLHAYYAFRKKKLGLSQQKVFDTYTPLVDDVEITHSFDKGIEIVLEASAPLGEEYTSILRDGLINKRWADRYENKGKRNGAYSAGCYDSYPYLLLNYKDNDIRDLFTLAHEAGHSMHSYFSWKHQKFQDSTYSIFVAESISTLSELLLSHHLKKKYAENKRILAYLINNQIDDIKATFFRQVMFAEFELQIHEILEKNEPLTVNVFRSLYRTLLNKYFGPTLEITATDELECFRIPHFYSAFYVYKYATGLSAAIQFSEKILSGEASARDCLLTLLKTGCSKHPLELIKDAGVDLASPKPIERTCALFESLVNQLKVQI